jgi:hypothetical protein
LIVYFFFYLVSTHDAGKKFQNKNRVFGASERTKKNKIGFSELPKRVKKIK